MTKKLAENKNPWACKNRQGTLRGGQFVLTSKYPLDPTPPKTRNPNALATKGATKVVRHEPLG